jgi:L-lactate dehydrogenase (cytochrome)
VNDFVELVARQLVGDLRLAPSTMRRRLAGRRRLDRCQTIADLRVLARRTVPRTVFAFADGAAMDEVTARTNETDFGRLVLHPRILVNVSRVDIESTVLGRPIAVPLLGAPTGLTGLMHHRGEVAVARAVHAAGSIYVQSALSSYSIEELAQHAPGPTWFQLYVWRDRGLVRELIERAGAAGHLALVLTGDTPYLGARERDLRNGFGIPPRVTVRSLLEGVSRPRWSVDFVRRPRMTFANAAGHGGGQSDARSLPDYIQSQFDPGLSWRDIEWLRETWSGPIVVKGVLRADDAAQAVRLGVDGLIVSNHGGRQLDHAPSSISALPAIVDAVAGAAEVYHDGGVRRGTDIVKALALGARAAFAGRALVYGLAAGGDAGAQRAMDILVRELHLAMALAGCQSVERLDRSWVSVRTGWGFTQLEPTPVEGF